MSTRTDAEHAHLEALLRAWVRETNTAVSPGPLTVPLPSTGLALHTEVRHASATGWHTFGPVTIGTLPADPVLAVALVAQELGGETADLVERTAESVRRVAGFLEHRGHSPTPADGFLDAEQSLLLGHLHHPAPKSRDGISDRDNARFAPELRGSFPLHWFAADPSVVSHAGGADVLMQELAGRHVDGKLLIPAHPWQAHDLVQRPRIRSLLEHGLLESLGEFGPEWFPTSSLRTVYRPGAPVMLKLSLGLRITNSRRESTATELRRGMEIKQLLDTGYAAETVLAHPEFTVVRDPSWIAVDEHGDVTGLDVAVRDVPPGLTDLRCLAGLVAPRPGIGPSKLISVVPDPAAWVASYTDHVLVPMLKLYAETGIGLEGHQQNTLVREDASGGAYRDNQGYYLASSYLPKLLDHLGAEHSRLAVVDDAIVDDRLTYYLLRNQALAPIGCFGAHGVADERELLGVLAGRLEEALPALAKAGPDGDRLARRWLTAPTLPCKGNLLTRLQGIDEVLAPLDAQSVYLDTPNPLLEAK
ncbi:siderophore synthetase [Lentzea tibetensis]|uniref:Siderophore synthetase n=1 Tax=Lentzea tibetensis TaxID=2591470 RepID=A0A563ET80_9PSEU|nr:IucA/IucC family protein [Lentzea tibetensis]TWP50863.1 siderophore synthetase [Lentzea tibetensis]